MNLNEIWLDLPHQEILFYLNQALNLIGTFFFWVFMLAIITCPVWVPTLVEGVLTR